MTAWVYILANRRYGALYTGVTTDLPARVTAHREERGGKFTSRYGITRLVYAEQSDSIGDAIAREKAINKWRRAWKIALIEGANPDWRDLYLDLNR